jgi:rod shape determining protein RodA
MSREQKYFYSNIDLIALVTFLVLILMGWLNIYAAVYNENHSSIFDISQRYGKQMVMIGVSLIVAILIMIMDARFFPALSWIFYGLFMLLLIAVLVFGTTIKGAQSWFQLGGFALQPAEFAKLGTALAIAHYLQGVNVSMTNFKQQLIAALIILAPMLFVLLQNDTGSALVFLSFSLVLYREGLPGWYLILGLWAVLLFVLGILLPFLPLLIGLGVLGLIVFLLSNKRLRSAIVIGAVVLASAGFSKGVEFIVDNVLQEHQRMRIYVLLNRADDPTGVEYNSIQSMNAIGSGGFFGKGFLQGTLTKGDFVPEQSTDFIFCTVGEEWGFVGTLIVVSLYLLLLIRIVMIAERQKLKYARVYGYAVASILFFHFLVNIGMTIGLLPIIGIPLPFFSSGGSSLLAFTILLFVLLRQDANRVNVL